MWEGGLDKRVRTLTVLRLKTSPPPAAATSRLHEITLTLQTAKSARVRRRTGRRTGRLPPSRAHPACGAPTTAPTPFPTPTCGRPPPDGPAVTPPAAAPQAGFRLGEDDNVQAVYAGGIAEVPRA
eukprot:6947114-Prymnesium_polylepis.1